MKTGRVTACIYSKNAHQTRTLMRSDELWHSLQDTT